MRSRWERRWGDGERGCSSVQVTDSRLTLPTAEVQIRAVIGNLTVQCPEKAPTRAISLLKLPTSAFTVKHLIYFDTMLNLHLNTLNFKQFKNWKLVHKLT